MRLGAGGAFDKALWLCYNAPVCGVYQGWSRSSGVIPNIYSIRLRMNPSLCASSQGGLAHHGKKNFGR